MLLKVIRALRADVGLTRNLGELGVTREAIPHLASLAMQDPCILTNPRKPSQADIEAIYEAAL
jgi:alcohol dehydrogenase class IV